MAILVKLVAAWASDLITNLSVHNDGKLVVSDTYAPESVSSSLDEILVASGFFLNTLAQGWPIGSGGWNLDITEYETQETLG